MTTAGPMTAQELLRLSLPDRRTELVRGRLIVREPAGGRHGAVANRLAYRLTAHVETGGGGRVYAAETGFLLASEPDTVRAPDVAVVGRARLPDPEPVGFLAGPPDLAVEVLNPNDRAGDILQKAGDWLSAGARLVWLIDPERHAARVYRIDGSVSLLGAGDALNGEDVLPGFVCPLSDIW